MLIKKRDPFLLDALTKFVVSEVFVFNKFLAPYTS